LASSSSGNGWMIIQAVGAGEDARLHEAAPASSASV
jgi:hypothetical protein